MIKSIKRLLRNKMILPVLNLVSSWMSFDLLMSAGFKRRYKLDFDATFNVMFPDMKHFRFMQIGANDGLSFDNLFERLQRRKTSGLAFEPSPIYFQQLTNNYKVLGDVTLINKAIHTSEKQIVLYELNERGKSKLPDWGKGIGSLSKEHLIKFGITELDIDAIEVEAISFQAVINQFPAFKAFDYLQIDTEGYDAEIIKSIPFEDCRIRMIKFETANTNEVSSRIVKEILQRNGYAVFEFVEDAVAVYRGSKLVFK